MSKVDKELYDTAVTIVRRYQRASTSYIQREMGLGYNHAAKLMHEMEKNGVVTAPNHMGKREVLKP